MASKSVFQDIKDKRKQFVVVKRILAGISSDGSSQYYLCVQLFFCFGCSCTLKSEWFENK